MNQLEKAIMGLLKKKKSISRSSLVKALGTYKQRVTYPLQKLEGEGLIEIQKEAGYITLRITRKGIKQPIDFDQNYIGNINSGPIKRVRPHALKITGKAEPKSMNWKRLTRLCGEPIKPNKKSQWFYCDLKKNPYSMTIRFTSNNTVVFMIKLPSYANNPRALSGINMQVMKRVCAAIYWLREQNLAWVDEMSLEEVYMEIAQEINEKSVEMPAQGERWKRDLGVKAVGIFGQETGKQGYEWVDFSQGPEFESNHKPRADQWSLVPDDVATTREGVEYLAEHQANIDGNLEKLSKANAYMAENLNTHIPVLQKTGVNLDKMTAAFEKFTQKLEGSVLEVKQQEKESWADKAEKALKKKKIKIWKGAYKNNDGSEQATLRRIDNGK